MGADRKLVTPFLGIRHGGTQGFPKTIDMIGNRQMDQLMRNPIIDQPNWQLDDPPVGIEESAGSA